jgi:hypothetical protein
VSHIDQANENRALVIPLDDPKSLGDFILGLLGQRRSIEQRFDDRWFFIDLNWLWNLDDIIEQRISAQNIGSLVSFSAENFFEDGRITRLTSRQAFRAYHDVSTRVAVGIDISWTYLIKFPNSKTPERQEIRFRAFTDNRAVTEKPPAKASKGFFKSTDHVEELFFSVSFSDLTWGEDISNHMSAFISSKTSRHGWMTRLIKSVDAKIILPAQRN